MDEPCDGCSYADNPKRDVFTLITYPLPYIVNILRGNERYLSQDCLFCDVGEAMLPRQQF